MSEPAPPGGRPVGVVTGGGGGIGAAVAEELGRQGWHVVTVDPLVSLDGSEQLAAPPETAADRIVAAGGSAMASAISVTDADAVTDLFQRLVAEHGRLDAVVNVAGISRPTSFAKGREDDWQAVLEVHLDGYLNVLTAALPIMAAAGRGHILGVTSGSGWRPADAGAYGCAKRAVAALTWQLGRCAPPGVVVNAMSPIAVTRMVTAALGRAGGGPSGAAGSKTGGLSLGGMPEPEQLGPLAAHLVDESFGWCRGQVVFAGGTEVAVVAQPRLIEAVRTDQGTSLAHLLDAVSTRVLVPAEAAQATTGGSNARSGSALDEAPVVSSADGVCVVISDRDELAGPVVDALGARSARTAVVAAADAGTDLAGAAAVLSAAAERHGPIAAVVVAVQGHEPIDGAGAAWQKLLAAHAGLPTRLWADARWARAVADHAAAHDRPLRLVLLVDAVEAGGRSRAQAGAQVARAGRRATDDRVAAFVVSVETADARDLSVVAELAAHLVVSAEAPGLAGAELMVERGWLGLRSHPQPSGSITFGGPELPEWFDEALRAIVGGPAEEGRP